MAWYMPWVEWLIHLIVDRTKVTSSHRLLCVAVGYQRRALPIIWDWAGHRKGHCTVESRLALWHRLHDIIPDDIQVTIVGDGEFGNVLVFGNIRALCDDGNFGLYQTTTAIGVPNSGSCWCIYNDT